MDKQRFTEDATVINNTDIIALNNVWCTMRDITNLEERRRWQEGRLYHITQQISNGSGGSGSPKGMDETFAELAGLDAEHEEACMVYVADMREAQKILDNIKNPKMKTFVTMMYVMNRPYSEVRKELNMTRRSFEAAKKAVEEASSMKHVDWKEKYVLKENKKCVEMTSDMC